MRAVPASGWKRGRSFVFCRFSVRRCFRPISDRLGRRPPLLFGIAVYIIASLVCVFANSMPMLLAGRLAQALGGCAGVVISRASVRDRFTHLETARIFSQLSLVMGLAPILAPLLGGLILQAAGWRPIFVALVLFGIACGAAVFFRLPESRSEATAATARGEHPFRAYLALLRQRRLVGYFLAGSLNGACLFTYISSSSGLLMGTYGVTPGQFGWFFGANAVGIIGGGQVNRYLLRRYTSDQVLSVFAVTGLGFAILLLIAAVTGLGGMWGVLVPLFLVLASYGVMTANTAAGALSVDPLRGGSTAALMGAGSFGAGSLASAIAGAMHDGTARPLAYVCCVCMAASTLGCWPMPR